MPRLIHLARASDAKRIERNGLSGRRATIVGHGMKRIGLAKAIYAMPQLRDFSISHQWLRELRQWHDERMVAVHMRLPSQEPVWAGRYNLPHELLPLGQAIKRVAAAPMGQELIIQRSVSVGEVIDVREVSQLVGWVGTPDQSQFDCVCIACLPSGSRDLMNKVRRAFDRCLQSARSAHADTERASALGGLDVVLERAKGRIEAKKLAAFTRSEHPQIRRVATNLMSYFRWADVEPFVVDRIDDEHIDVRHAAVRSMVRSAGLRRAHRLLERRGDPCLMEFLEELEWHHSQDEATAVLELLATRPASPAIQRRINEIRAAFKARQPRSLR